MICFHKFGRSVLARRGALAAALVLLAACSSDAVPRDMYYRLQPAADAAALAGGPIKGTVEVPAFRAAGLVGDRAIMYRQGPSQLSQYSYHFWEQAPANMVQRDLVDMLRRVHAFDNVVTPEMRLDRDYELVGSIRQFEHVLNGGSAAVVVEIEIGLRRVRGNTQVLLKTYRAEQPTSGADVNGAVNAFGQALNTVFAAFLADLAAVPKG